MVEFGQPSVVFEFPSVANFGCSVVVGILPSRWLLIVVVGSVGFVGRVGVVVYGVEFPVDVGGGFVGEVFDDFSNGLSLVSSFPPFHGGFGLHVVVRRDIVVEFSVE